MAGEKRLSVIITGKIEGLKNAFREAEGDTDSLISKIGGAGTIIAGGLAAAGSAAVAFGVKSANTFENVGSEVLKLKRYTGETAEESSRLRFAFEETGIDVDSAAKSMGIFSKKLEASKDPMKDFGVQTRDAKGNLLPMREELERFSDKISAMPDGVEKNALVLKAFGRSGMDLLPFLNKGRQGIDELMQSADKYGVVLSQSNLDAVMKSKMAHREFTAAMQGLQIQIGQYVLPVITEMTKWFAEKIPQAMARAKQWITDHHDQLQKIVDKAQSLAAEWLPKLADWIGKVGDIVFKVTGWLMEHKAVLGAVAVALGLLVAPFTTVVAAILYAYNNWQWFHNAVDATISWLTGTAWPAIQQFWANFMAGVAVVRQWWDDHWNQIHAILSSTWDAIKNVISNAWQIISNEFQFVLNVLQGKWGAAWDNVKNIASAAWDGIKNIVSNGWDVLKNGTTLFWEFLDNVGDRIWGGIKSGFRAAINWVIDHWNSLQFDVPGFDFLGQHFGGFTLGVPDIPRLHSGGVFQAPIGTGEGLALLRDGERILTPGQAVGGNTVVNLTVHAGMGTDGVTVGKQIVDALAKWQQAGGRIPSSLVGA